ncbi:MAG TPA: Rieske 2Fe-2S domain-containing protein [Acidimicrobiales bacterium]|nr:Rieske 2Fe-2S domain-containing protein [Acidimicrobiales bacterium]
MTSIDIGVLDDFEQGVPRQLHVEGRTLVAVRIDDQLYVLDDRCSHEEFSLSEGEVDTDTAEIECARHGAMFRLSDGAALTLPATRSVGHYDVRENAGRLEVEIP